jgi:hypothetical protein
LLIRTAVLPMVWWRPDPLPAPIIGFIFVQNLTFI